MAKKEFKVGEEFQFGMIKLKCEESKYGCSGCYFYRFSNACKEFEEVAGNCLSENREDEKDVIFVKVEE